MGFNTPIKGNYTDSFRTMQALNLSIFFAPETEGFSKVKIAQLEHIKSIHIPSSQHWSEHILHPGLAILVLFLVSLSILLHCKNYVDQFKMIRVDLRRLREHVACSSIYDMMYDISEYI